MRLSHDVPDYGLQISHHITGINADCAHTAFGKEVIAPLIVLCRLQVRCTIDFYA